MRSRNHCCRGKATSVTYSECVSVFLPIYATCNAHALYYIVIYVLSGSATFSHIIS